VIGKDRSPATHGVCSYGTLVGSNSNPDEPLRKFSIGLLSHQLIAGITPPEIHPTDLKEFAGRMTKQMD
jgi:hypothetical protein